MNKYIRRDMKAYGSKQTIDIFILINVYKLLSY